LAITVFAAAALVIALAGTRLARVADELAVRTGLGEVLFGAVFIGISTSLPGIVTSMATAAQNHPNLAIGNALGGIAAQTAFLGVADITYRRANLEHAAASASNLVQGALLVTLLALVLAASTLPPVAVLGISPVTPILLLAYLGGLRLLRSSGTDPMWRPRATPETQREEQEKAGKLPGSSASLWLQFLLLAMLLGVVGFVVAEAGIVLAELSGLSETAVGVLLTAVATSLPELVIAIAAVRIGALNLAVGNILGGNCFDILFLAGVDLAYRQGSIFTAFADADRFLASTTILMVAVLLLGLLRRERYGIGGIGFESAGILTIYGLLVLVMTT